MRKKAEIQKAEQELFDKRWYRKHRASGSPKVGEKAARKIEKKYGKENLRVDNDYKQGMLDGKHSAIRWVLGDEWDNLDT